MAKLIPAILVVIACIAVVVEVSLAASVWQPIEFLQAPAASPESAIPVVPTSKVEIHITNTEVHSPKTTETSRPVATASKTVNHKTEVPKITVAPKPATTKPAATVSVEKPPTTSPAIKGIVKNSNHDSSSSPTHILPTTPIAATTVLVIAPSKVPAASKDSGVSGGAIGSIVAIITVCIAGIAAFVFVKRKKSAKRTRALKADPFNRGFGSHDPQPLDDMSYPPHSAYAMASTNYQYNSGSNPMVTSSNAVSSGAYRPLEEPAHAPYSPEQSAAYYQTQKQHYDDSSTVYSPQLNPLSYHNTAYPDPNVYNGGYTSNTSTAHYGDVSTATYNNTYPADPSAYDYNTNPTFQQHQQIQSTTLGPMSQTSQPSFAVQPPPVSQSLGVFTVASTYTPTLGDELYIYPGDRVEVLVEYDDGWCQGVNLSKGNTKGVFPKHCLEGENSLAYDSQVPNNPLAETERNKRVSSMYAMQHQPSKLPNHY